MFISTRRAGYDRHGQQVASGRFLLLVQSKDGNARDPIRALVRFVSLTQFGHFMMGSARAFGHHITVSGSYGSDGLPCSVPPDVYAKAVPVPSELIEMWNKGGGWNGAGSEAPLMREWARKTFPKNGK